MKTADFIREHNACREGARWALSISADMSAVWDAMIEQGKHDWLIWTATRPGVFPDSTLRKLACRFVRETPLSDGRMVWDLLTDDRSRRAIEVAEAFANGKATESELSAAYAAAYSAACVAAEAAAYAAAYSAACVAAEAAADAAAEAAAWAAACVAAARYTVDAARAAAFYDASADAKSAQVQMIAELGNPFKKGAYT
jgi:hypothetical protein